MENSSVLDLTTLLDQIDQHPSARDDLFRLIEHRFRAMANKLMRRERPDHTLQPTVLVDDAFGQLLKNAGTWENREQFFCSAAKVMRRMLVDHARHRNAQKRGAGEAPVPLDDQRVIGFSNDPQKLVELNDIVEKLEIEHPETFNVFNLHYFMGWELQEIADEILDVSYSTVKRRWGMARAFLRSELAGDDD